MMKKQTEGYTVVDMCVWERLVMLFSVFQAFIRRPVDGDSTIVQ